jgi:hypothetical protein
VQAAWHINERFVQEMARLCDPAFFPPKRSGNAWEDENGMYEYISDHCILEGEP